MAIKVDGIQSEDELKKSAGCSSSARFYHNKL